MKIIWLIPILFLIAFPLAYAHPFLLDSEPAQGQSVSIGTTQIITYYSEAVEIDFSELNTLSKFEIPKVVYFLPQFIETETKKIQRKKTLDLIKF